MAGGLQPAAWHDLYVALATTFGALLGLVLVAISIHIHEVEENPLLRQRARATTEALASLVTLALCVLIPGQGTFWLGVEFVAIMVAYLVFLVSGAWGTRRAVGGFSKNVWLRFTPNTFAFFTIAAGVSLIAGSGPGLYLVLPTVLLGVPSATFNLWSLLFAPELKKK